ncbi:MAG: M43 family zinc metalloprotease [Bacteroidota bacterium]|nr:M43 family zinc metalloprotease [Bacteroidota bacterium]
MGRNISSLLFFCLVLMASIVKSQDFKCGTVVPSNARQIEEGHYQSLLSLYEFQGITNCLNKVLSINYIIVTDSLNDLGLTIANINNGVQSLNNWFSPICLSFQVCSIDTVYAYKYNKWHAGQEHDEFVALYCKENVINIVLVEEIEDPGGANGYAPLGISMPGSPRYDLICIAKNGVNGKTLYHEMGHFFGLYHPFEVSLGNELVNGSNCTIAGDLVCDTPADINPAPIDPGCVWNGTNVDANNDYYTPILGNIMSYHDASCALSFTTDQYNRMIFCFLNYRNYLY